MVLEHGMTIVLDVDIQWYNNKLLRGENMQIVEMKVANMHEKLDDLKDACLRCHGDSITYQLCELLQELIHDIVLKE